MGEEGLAFEVMCGRFVSATSPDELADYFGAVLDDGDAAEVAPSYNVAPTSEVLLVRARDNERHLEALRWGLVPFWAENPKIGAKMTNARSETVAEKPAFRRSFAKRRCLIPVDGFYEWSKVEGLKTKQPWYISRADGEPLAFAGLWEWWRPKPEPGADDGGDGLETFTILTCGPNATMEPIHHRMPVMVANQHWDYWLDPVSDQGELLNLLVPAPDDLLTAVPVSTEVNRATNNGAHLLEPSPPVDAGMLPGFGGL